MCGSSLCTAWLICLLVSSQISGLGVVRLCKKRGETSGGDFRLPSGNVGRSWHVGLASRANKIVITDWQNKVRPSQKHENALGPRLNLSKLGTEVILRHFRRTRLSLCSNSTSSDVFTSVLHRANALSYSTPFVEVSFEYRRYNIYSLVTETFF